VIYKYKNIELFKFNDVYNPEDESKNTFMRTIGNYKLYYVSGEYSLLNSFSA
jgi:hypothetical protein